LFANNKTTVERKQRLFLITPRIIQSEGSKPISAISYAVPPTLTVPASQPTALQAVQPPIRQPDQDQSPSKMRMDTQINFTPALQSKNK
jgi:type II secretory pathway component GspD/PulD (secretin)